MNLLKSLDDHTSKLLRFSQKLRRLYKAAKLLEGGNSDYKANTQNAEKALSKENSKRRLIPKSKNKKKGVKISKVKSKDHSDYRRKLKSKSRDEESNNRVGKGTNKSFNTKREKSNFTPKNGITKTFLSILQS